MLQLASDCDMETTIRSVDHLRRLDVDGDELELRVRFLQVKKKKRYCFFFMVCRFESNGWRVENCLFRRPLWEDGSWLMLNVFELISSTWSLSNQLLGHSFCSPKQEKKKNRKRYNTLFAGECAGGSHLLWAFASRKVREFVEVLEANVPLVTDGEELGAIMEQCM